MVQNTGSKSAGDETSDGSDSEGLVGRASKRCPYWSRAIGNIRNTPNRSIAFVEPYGSKRSSIISSCTTPPALEMPVTGAGSPMLDSNHTLRSYDARSRNSECMNSWRVICTPSNMCGEA